MAFTVGHTVLGQTDAALDISRHHEIVHVRQVERWGGPLMGPAYLGCSLVLWLLPHDLRSLPFQDGAFDLALCSHLLFTYSEQLSASFHVEAVLEMCRVAREVRIFPLLEMSGEPSEHVPAVCKALDRQGFRWAIEAVEYEFQRRGNKMLRVQCHNGQKP